MIVKKVCVIKQYTKKVINGVYFNLIITRTPPISILEMYVLSSFFINIKMFIHYILILKLNLKCNNIGKNFVFITSNSLLLLLVLTLLLLTFGKVVLIISYGRSNLFNYFKLKNCILFILCLFILSL